MDSANPVIEVFADICCPFAHVGLRMIAEERHRLRQPGAVLRVRPWPLELVNGQPMDASATHEHIADLQAQVAADMFVDVAEPFPSTSLPALALVERAYRDGLEVGERASFDVRDALFERGLDVSDTEVIAMLADEIGVGLPDPIDHDAVRASWHEGSRRGVQGSPHIFCGESDSFCPSLDISGASGHLSIVPDRSALEQFLRAALL